MAHTRPACRYDAADVASHVYRQLAADGYQGLPIHNIYRDEVQAGLPAFAVRHAIRNPPQQQD